MSTGRAIPLRISYLYRAPTKEDASPDANTIEHGTE